MIPETHVDIFESKSFAHLATVMPDATPHVTPVWVDHEDREYVLVNTARGRQKERNVRRNPHVALSVTDPDDPYRYVAVRGRAELVDEGAEEHIAELAERYRGVEEYTRRGTDAESRVVVKIAADHVATWG